MIAAGVRFGCVLADAGYGMSAPFRHALSGCAEGSVEATELETIADTIERYEAARWPAGRNADDGRG